MHGQGGIYYSNENYFYKGEFKNGELTGRGVFFYSDYADFYMGEVRNGKFHGKGLYYRRENNSWELNDYEEGRIAKMIKAGDGRPQSLEISKEMGDTQDFEEIYIKPKDLFFDHYEGDLVNGKKEGNGTLF
mmetsp:Transcript_39837/g.38404  ORF Transcript_39837/g.38404 Transcript_39837/m.38404 type:complete len:131 (+) Transcript_39837:356-748(+)|eukprot:CAMPEP_0170553262 /NCGR_PEP_ID=MMETSP0211-20121228/11065_1 /TAXON_ID=311385 /ORGANISM="Pseudokeronopsis sp., Strain OXSARD2" /LENGTH=130 /DNA_ID=CAMNT_0010861453 /DNA_START=314 /DNA_END=706 /DNA_ORIENTATION=+